MIERAYNFTCDYCGAKVCYISDNMKEAREQARDDGWILYHRRNCFCSGECFVDYE